MTQATRTQDLTAQVDGVAVQFTTPETFIAGSLVVYVDGARLRPGQWTEDSTTQFTLTGAPVVGEGVLVQYEIAAEVATKTAFEDLTAQVDGATTLFTTSTGFILGSLVVYQVGDRIRPANYTEVTTTTFTVTPAPPVGTGLQVQYEAVDVSSPVGLPFVRASGIPPTT